ncbi:chromophore lyase CpcT/CpeT [Aliterella atlantica]|uniref:Chromophore lyase CpcT/CpeT n=1 Tax=Aliterella atlantica CENA595 TaxID=1618023 RepID=A0A0D8ZQ39_9CYAN|nr:chromophore lyase CpcT/CpeT [Aliterella atlantica]KJH70840.1 chorismate mutase [Aliterella atlantica CENA595]
MISSELKTLAQYMTGEFDNKEQALADPAWYVHLRTWQITVPFFTEDSITIFAEQANIMSLHKPYRPRLLRLQQKQEKLQVQYYMPKDPAAVNGAATNPELLKSLTIEQFELLPGCLLDVKVEHLADGKVFTAALAPDCRCCFNYAGEVREVSLGFQASKDEFLSYDKGIDSTTGKALWGAILGPFRFRKR